MMGALRVRFAFTEGKRQCEPAAPASSPDKAVSVPSRTCPNDLATVGESVAESRTRRRSRCCTAVTVARPCNSYRDCQRQQKSKLPMIQACATGMDIARPAGTGSRPPAFHIAASQTTKEFPHGKIEKLPHACPRIRRWRWRAVEAPAPQ
jgi:hypothetical protein